MSNRTAILDADRMPDPERSLSVSLPRVLVCGMACAASAPPLAALLGAGFPVAALVLPEETAVSSGPGSPAPSRSRGMGAADQPGLAPETWDRAIDLAPVDPAHGSEPERLAMAAGVPVLRVRPADPRLLDLAAQVDVLVVVCFPTRLPEALLARPRWGGVNVHPSLLPLGRGPEPVFWTLRRGERETGTTIHLLDRGFDTGPMLAQRTVPVPPGIRAPILEWELMTLGGELLVEMLPRLMAGNVSPLPQDDARATLAPHSTPADWLLPTNLPAGWAFSVARGLAPLAGPLAVHGSFGTIPVRDAVAVHPEERPDLPLEPRPGGRIRVRFTPGWVEFVTEGGEWG